MAARRRVEDEASWVSVARRELPGHLTWAGFCRLMRWPGMVPTHPRTHEDQPLSFMERAAAALEMEVPEFIRMVLDERRARTHPDMEV
jgi:hypothetical protein